jgi:hypothetical protein
MSDDPSPGWTVHLQLQLAESLDSAAAEQLQAAIAQELERSFAAADVRDDVVSAALSIPADAPGYTEDALSAARTALRAVSGVVMRRATLGRLRSVEVVADDVEEERGPDEDGGNENSP